MFASVFGLPPQHAAAQSSSRNTSKRFLASEPFNATNKTMPQSLRAAAAPFGLVQLL